jgi:hypothetical protein
MTRWTETAAEMQHAHEPERVAQMFVDMDGVLADFDSGHEAAFGYRSDKLADNVDWSKVRAFSGFYQGLPPMPDMHDLWAYIKMYRPIVLTGVPSSVTEAPDNKREWIIKHLGPRVEVRCCRSSEKCLHARPGDILIDDWTKYRHLWLAKGGRWITHMSAAETIRSLREIGL